MMMDPIKLHGSSLQLTVVRRFTLTFYVLYPYRAYFSSTHVHDPSLPIALSLLNILSLYQNDNNIRPTAAHPSLPRAGLSSHHPPHHILALVPIRHGTHLRHQARPFASFPAAHELCTNAERELGRSCQSRHERRAGWYRPRGYGALP